MTRPPVLILLSKRTDLSSITVLTELTKMHFWGKERRRSRVPDGCKKQNTGEEGCQRSEVGNDDTKVKGET